MELNFPPSQENQPIQPSYVDASQLDIGSANAVTPPLIPVKRRLRFDRLLILVALLALVGTGVTYGGIVAYRAFTNGNEQETEEQPTTKFKQVEVATSLSGQNFLFYHPEEWQVFNTLLLGNPAVGVTPKNTTLLSGKKPVAAFSVAILPMSASTPIDVLGERYLNQTQTTALYRSKTFIGLSIPAIALTTKENKVLIAPLKTGKHYVIISQPIMDTIEEGSIATTGLELFKKTVMFE
jgi:hypothetical protein